MSLQRYVEGQWEFILSSWRNGWAAETLLADLERSIEFHRDRIFDKRSTDGQFDWELDWIKAKTHHDSQVDFVRNRKQYFDDVRRLWSEWTERNQRHVSDISLEALRSMVLVNGAAIIAALAVLSGQITHPWAPAVTVAKITILTSVVSLLMMATGHALLVERISHLNGRVRSVLIGNAKHSLLLAVYRYLRRHLDPTIRLANALIYGSIACFGLSAIISAIILLISEGP